MGVQYAAAASVYSEGEEIIFRRIKEERKLVQIKKKNNKRQLSLGPLKCLRQAFFPPKKSAIESSSSATDPAEGIRDDEVEQGGGECDSTDGSACVSSEVPSTPALIAWDSEMALAGDTTTDHEDILHGREYNDSFGDLLKASLPRDLKQALKHIDSSDASATVTSKRAGRSSPEDSSLQTQKRSHTEKTMSYLQLSILDDLLHDKDVDGRSTTSNPIPPNEPCRETSVVEQDLEQEDTHGAHNAEGDYDNSVDSSIGLRAVENCGFEIDKVKPIRKAANTKRSKSFLQLNLTRRRF